MSEFFGLYKRPKSEINIINKFQISFEKSQNFYKNKDYLQALEELKISYNFLNDIWDEYPKIRTLFLIIKSLFYTKKFMECLSLKPKILEKILIETKRDKEKSQKKQDIFIKIKSKISMYTLIINFILDKLDNSVESVIEVIKDLSENNNYSLDDKIKYFWNYIKTLLKISGITKTYKFELFKQDYNSMLVIEKKNNNNLIPNNQCIYEPIKKIEYSILDKYKLFMNSKLRNNLYVVLDNEYYFINFGLKNDRVMKFLQKNMHMYVRENNKEKLVELFQSFLFLGKIDLKKKFNMNMNELLYVQKRRIEKFDVIFASIIGAFSHIFKKYFNKPKKLYFSNSTKKNNSKSNTNIKEIENQIKLLKSTSLFNMNKNKGYKEDAISSFDYNNINEIKIPPNSSITPKTLFTKKKVITTNKNTFNKSNIRNKFILKQPLLSYTYLNVNNNTNLKKLFIKKKTGNSPIINNHDNFLLNFSDGEIQINLHKKNNIREFSSYNIKRNDEIRKLKKNKVLIIKEKNNFILRNINNILITKLIDLFLQIYKLENNLFFEDEEKIKYKNIYPRKIDLYNNLNIPKIIKSYYSISVKGSNENQVAHFYYKDYMLIKNLILLGICDGHGNFGNLVSDKISILFPAYLLYIIIEDFLIKENKDINKEIYKLFKLKENPKEVKDMYLLRYFFNKFKFDFKDIPLFKGNLPLLKKQIYESLHYSHNDLKIRYNIDYEFSGSTLCSCFIMGYTLYIINVGDSQIILGSLSNNSNRWEVTYLSVKHTFEIPGESNRIILNGGRVDRMKNEKGKEAGPIRMYENKIESNIPGLAMSRSIGDNFAKKFGVSYEPDISKYNLKKEDKIIIIGNDGLFNCLNSEEIINELGNFYKDNKNAEEAAIHLIDYAKFKSTYRIKKKKKKFEINNNIYKGNYDDITCIVVFLEN